MSALQPNPRPPPPGDEDLQHLYDEVWRIFGEESTSPSERSPFTTASLNSREHYPNAFRAEPDPTSPPVSTVSRSAPRLPRTYHPYSFLTDRAPVIFPEQSPLSPSNLDSAVSPTSQRRLRPLPLPPGAALPTVSSPTDPHDVPQAISNVPQAMPNVSQVMPNVTRPGTASVDRYANSGCLFCPSYTSACSRRQLPQAPSPQSPYIPSRGSTGSVTSPGSGKPITSPQSDIPPNVHKPVPAVPPLPNGNGPTVDDIRGHLSRNSSARPPGALAPTIPGYTSQYDESSLLDMYATDDPIRSRPSHQQQLSGQSKYGVVYPQANTRLHPDNSGAPRAKDYQPQYSSSSDFIHRKSSTQIPGLAMLKQLLSQAADAGLGRATSTGSTISSAQTDLLGRNPSATTTATTNSDYPGSKGGASALARNDSAGSYALSAGPSTVTSPETYDDSANGYGTRGASTESFDRSRANDYGTGGSSGGALADQEEEDDYFTDSDDPDPDRFVNFSLLSHLAVRLRDKVPRGTHVKSSIPYPRAFTGKDIVVCGHVLDVHP